ncbi:hypothetical protein MY04_0489 [Flammeovirga sp. MY04]|uniref:hypothetical protein n=1 Tax=Flammeovirga sp. MY04 TaxID=1191459 RepID=UPI000826F2D3|nr:hypothetical protein [Flammeovirga sp. MY04]ANQ47871.2 hypothetical protein MY04_0489 [Flammeovirga sp. MY04]
MLLIDVPKGWVDFNLWIRNGWGAYAKWFIPVLFLASLFAKLINNIKNRYLLFGCAFMFATISGVLSFYKIQFTSTMSSTPFATFIIVMGAELKRLNSVIADSKLLAYVDFILCNCRYFILLEAGFML